MRRSVVLKQSRNALIKERNGILDSITDAATQFTDEVRSKVNGLNEQIRRFDTDIIEAEALEDRELTAGRADVRDGAPTGVEHRTGSARVTNEARTYSPEKSKRGEASFFQDLYSVQTNGDFEARERLSRHDREAEVEGEKRSISQRATTTGSFAGLVVPQYLVDEAALLARAGRPLANTVRSLPLPAQGTTFQIPRGTTGASEAIQASENTTVSNTDEVWANLTLNVATLAGQQDVSRQSLERGTPGLDSLVYTDLAQAYAAQLDLQVINGSGTGGQVLGILGTSGINAATAFGAAVTAANFYTKVAGQVAAVTATRFVAPDTIAMHPRRLAWLLAQSDSTGRPLVVPGASFNAQGSVDHPAYGEGIGTFLGMRIVVDANLPTNVGTNSEDVVLVYRAADVMLWEDGDGMPRQLRFEQTLGGQLTVKLVAYGYFAFTAGRYPAAVGKVGGADGTAGQGLIAPVF